jgi:hypothetical protein
MTQRYRVLIIGGYGIFGQRIARALAKDARFHLLIAGRSIDKARLLCDDLPGKALAQPVVLDIEVEEQLHALLAAAKPDLVIHTSGPFQYRDQTVAKACIAARVHYVDLADARDFVCRFAELDGFAREQAVLAVTGASSVPGLSAAVIDHFVPEFARLDAIDFGISPGNQTPRGLATVQSILSYCGKPFLRWQRGAWEKAYGWQTLRAVRYPAPIGKRWMGNCDIPDLQLFPERYPTVQEVIFRAGLELPLLHWGTWLLSWGARVGLVHDWARYAPALKRISEWFIRKGSTHGGMHLVLTGLNQHAQVYRRTWFIVAEKGDGLQIPCTAAILLAKKLAGNQLAIRGAMPCMGLFSLQEFMDALAGYSIRVVTRSEVLGQEPRNQLR